MKEVVVADPTGFCFGVKRAIDEIVRALSEKEDVWSIGMPIHNAQEVARLSAMGLKVAKEAGDIPDGAKVVVRAHGIARAVFAELRNRGAQVIDMTCPFVRRAQVHAAELSSQGFHVVLLGDARHPEIRSIMGCVDGTIEVVADVDEAKQLSRRPRMALISQTTQQEERLVAVAAVLVRKAEELHVCNTVCRATLDRQNAVRSLAGKVDGLVVVGGRDSANTSKLRDIAKTNGMDVVWIEKIDEMDRRWLEGKNRIGIAAGASTPQWLITEVCNTIARS
ncbi:MAG: 4-hydroxy-3-methylbut-2-enyl diphosphate reductase [Synergistaceae bacterium]|nr:4-hydroxy-3-methylbut-2-enyl diphosphate reductase [Synergistaceae bacterium]